MADETPTPRGIHLVARVIDGAREVPPLAMAEGGAFGPPLRPPPPAPPPDEYGDDDDDGGGRKKNKYGLPEGCPVVPLGVSGDVFHYLDELGQHIELEGGKHGKLAVATLFKRRQHMLFTFWPRTNKDGDVTGWHADKGAMALQIAASKRGVWDPFKKMRGAGAWLGDDGGLVLHCGDEILIGDGWRKPGEYERYVYPTADTTLKPSPVGAHAGTDGCAEQLLALLNTWNWKRKEVYSWLLMGWIAAAMVGGALRWRPVVWITAPAGSGKSTLQNDLVTALFDGGLRSVDDATPASVRDAARYSTLPIAIDEAEPDPESRRVDGMIRLARSAASGSITMRSSSDNVAKHFVVRQCFMFSSVLVPGMQAADRSRIAILELGDLNNEAPPKLEPKRMRVLGAAILHRMVDQWHRWPQALEAYRTALTSCGHGGRAADVFGTLLAAADLLSSDAEVDSDTAREWADKLGLADMVSGVDNARDEERTLRHMISSIIPFDGVGERNTVAKWVTLAIHGDFDQKANAERVLGNYGMRVMKREGDRQALLVANDHQGVARIFQGTHWAAKSGAQGVWVQALRRLPLAEPTDKVVRIGGVPCRGTYVDAGLVVDTDYEPAGGKQFNYEE